MVTHLVDTWWNTWWIVEVDVVGHLEHLGKNQKLLDVKFAPVVGTSGRAAL